MTNIISEVVITASSCFLSSALLGFCGFVCFACINCDGPFYLETSDMCLDSLLDVLDSTNSCLLKANMSSKENSI